MEVICITWLRLCTLIQSTLHERWLLLSVAQSLPYICLFISDTTLLPCHKNGTVFFTWPFSHSLSSHWGHLSWFHIPEHFLALTSPSKWQSQLAHAPTQSTCLQKQQIREVPQFLPQICSSKNVSAKLRFTSQRSTEQSRYTLGNSAASPSEILWNVRNWSPSALLKWPNRHPHLKDV